MIGFLGTVIGMIVAIHEIANAGGQIDIKLLSDGLYTAMTTTVAGLIVGIITYIAYNHLIVRTNKVVYLMEVNPLEFLDLLNEPASTISLKSNMDIRGRNKINPNFNMSSMTELVFLILIFFMIISTLVTTRALDILLLNARGTNAKRK